MTRSEFAVWAMALKTYFPRDNLLPTKESMELWYQEVQDIPQDVATAMLRKWVNTNNWPPTISEVRTICAEIRQGPIMQWGDGWEEVVKAIRRHGYCSEKEAYESMSPTTRSAVSKIGWREICMSENPEAIRAQFRQVFEICQKRETEDRQLTPAVKAVIAQIAGGEGGYLKAPSWNGLSLPEDTP